MGQVHFGQPRLEVPAAPEKKGIQKFIPKTHFLIKWCAGGGLVTAGMWGMCNGPNKWYTMPTGLSMTFAGAAIWRLENGCYWTRKLPFEAD